MDVSYIPSLMDFPDDVLIIIFDQLDVEDLKSITLINSRCLQLATTTQSINKKFKLTIKEDSNAVIFEALMESNRYFKSVCIKHTRDEYGRDCSLNPIINLMKRIGAYTKNMEFKCEFHNWHRKPLIDLLELLPNVVTLNLICGRYHFEESLASPIQLKFNQLKEAKLPFNMLCDTLKQVNTLEKLEALDSSFHATNSERNLEFVHILRNNQSTLKSLKFNYNHIRQLDIQVLLKISSNLQQQYYNIKSCFRLFVT